MVERPCPDKRPRAVLNVNIMERQKLVYRIGDMVRIKTGPFASFTGRVEGINQSKSLLKVKLEIYGRVTPIKVNFFEAEKLEFQNPLPPSSTQN
jgi:transcription antitermination factor NusG